MAFSKEVIEFGQKGLKELKTEVRDLKEEMTKTHKANDKLRQQLSDGTWEKHAKRLQSARTAMAGFRREQEALQRTASRTLLDSRYGRVGGAIAFHGGGVARGIGGAVSGIGGGLFGAAAAFGAPLALGAMANRGFQGTAAAARLDMEFTRLSRHVANELLPAITALTNFIARFSNSADKVRAGTATRGDYGNNLLRKSLYAGAAWTAVSAMGFRPASWAASMAANYGGQLFNAARAGIPREAETLAVRGGSRGAGAMLGAIGGAGIPLLGAGYSQYSDYRALRKSRNQAGVSDADTASQQDLINEIRSLSPAEQAKRLELESQGAKNAVGHYEGMRGRQSGFKRFVDKLMDQPLMAGFSPNYVGSKLGLIDDPNKMQAGHLNALSRQRVIEAMKRGELPGGNDATGMMMVAGAGERRGLTDVHQELAESIAQTLAGGSGKGGDSPNVILQAIRDITNDVAGFISGGQLARR